MDYKKLGLKCGLEIHQQLEGHKLFCNCSTEIIRKKQPDFIIEPRKQRTSASELGKIDAAARYEFEKGKYFSYEGYHHTNCLYCIDEEPPTKINEQALVCALQIAKILHCYILDEMHVMRKVVIDGSNTSAFQRTALVAVDGFLETSEGKVRIASICLEEESAQKVADTNEKRTYNISRLGIPLIEIATEPDIKYPEQAKETAEHIGMILRSITGVKRGIGTIRQDVNISITGGARTEVKGFQELKSIPKVIMYEIQRQQQEIKNKKKIEKTVRKAEKDGKTSFLRPMPGAARMYPETDVPPIHITQEILKKIAIPKLLTEMVDTYAEKFSLDPNIARELIKGDIPFIEYVQKYQQLKPAFIAEVVLNIPKELKARFNITHTFTEDEFNQVLKPINDACVPKDAALALLHLLGEGKKLDINKLMNITDDELEKVVKEIIKKNKGAPINALMGEVMKELRGKVEGKKVMSIIKKFM